MKLLIYIEKNKAGYLDLNMLTPEEERQIIELAHQSEGSKFDIRSFMMVTRCKTSGVLLWDKFKDIVEVKPFKVKEPEIVEEKHTLWERIEIQFMVIWMKIIDFFHKSHK